MQIPSYCLATTLVAVVSAIYACDGGTIEPTAQPVTSPTDRDSEGQTKASSLKYSFKEGDTSVTFFNEGQGKDKIRVEAIIVDKKGSPVSGVKVQYALTCGKNKATATVAATGNDGAAAAEAVITGVTESLLRACKATASIDDGNGVVELVLHAGENLKMGTYYEFRWVSSWDTSKCDYKKHKIMLADVSQDKMIYKLDDWKTPSDYELVGVLVLPTAKTGASCTIGGYEFAFERGAYSDRHTAKNINCEIDVNNYSVDCWKPDDACYNPRGDIPCGIGGSKLPVAGDKVIKYVGSGSYVFYNIPK